MTEDQQDQLVISLDTQYAVAHAIYNRFHANGHRKHLTWENLDDDGREPWRLIAKDAIRTFFASPEFQTLLDDVYDGGYEAAEKDAQGENEGEEPR